MRVCQSASGQFLFTYHFLRTYITYFHLHRPCLRLLGSWLLPGVDGNGAKHEQFVLHILEASLAHDVG